MIYLIRKDDRAEVAKGAGFISVIVSIGTGFMHCNPKCFDLTDTQLVDDCMQRTSSSKDRGIVLVDGS